MTRRRRWPDGAESHRQAAVEHIRHARNLIRAARANSRINPTLLELQLADADTNLGDAENRLLRARLGEPEEPDDDDDHRSATGCQPAQRNYR